MSGSGYSCGVLNCGGGKCVHRLTREVCPCCGARLVEVVTTGVLFCSNHPAVCEYERDVPARAEKGQSLTGDIATE